MFVPAKQSVDDDDDDDDDDGCWEHRVDVSHARISARVSNTVRQSFMGIPNAMNISAQHNHQTSSTNSQDENLKIKIQTRSLTAICP